MDKYNRNYNYAFDRRNDDYGVYGSGDYDSNYYHEPERDLRGKRSYDSHPYNRTGYDNDRNWRRSERFQDNDRNVFERAGDKIRETWNDWTEGDRPRQDRYDWMNRDRSRDYRGNYYQADQDRGYTNYADRGYRSYDRHEGRRDDRNFFERAGDAMRDFFRAPDSDDYREYDGPQDYGSKGFGNYSGSYGGYTGEHGLTGFNTGNESRDNYTTDYNAHYREPGFDSSYRRDDVYRRRYDNEYRRRHNY